MNILEIALSLGLLLSLFCCFRLASRLDEMDHFYFTLFKGLSEDKICNDLQNFIEKI